MDKVIKIDINIDHIKDILAPFNDKIIKDELISYLFESCKGKSIKDKVLLNIGHICFLSDSEKEEIKYLINNSLLKELDENNIEIKLDRIRYLIALVIGIILIIIGFLNINVILSEVFNIFGWVAIWEVGYKLFFTDTKRNRKIKRTKQLLNCEVLFTKK